MTLPESAQALLSALKRLADGDGAVQLSAKALAKEAGISVGAVAKAKARLEEEGYIRVEPSPNRYRQPDTIILLRKAPGTDAGDADAGMVETMDTVEPETNALVGASTVTKTEAPKPSLKSTPDPPTHDHTEPARRVQDTNADGQAWLAKLFQQIDPSITPVAAEALAGSDFYCNLAWAMEYLHRVMTGREMATPLTRKVLELLINEMQHQLRQEETA